MFKTSRIATTVLAAAGAALAAASPALADDDLAFGPGVNASNNWDYTAVRTCFQELAVVPVGGSTVVDAVDHCVQGNVLNHVQG
ncbi:hypothetical protein BBK82_44995 [Lentzea guizhouensis]|uniref:Secreted protein n=1 Tax=Lentzea guizhouensis TaxID=1586287 RepID=A0A1B2HWF3_9PSEU|nr:hypothetical protein [Lentzea guizhouensis]ANZ42033.1 hypothetical protein BBK82_44995 [Lentzea guizhouensis]